KHAQERHASGGCVARSTEYVETESAVVGATLLGRLYLAGRIQRPNQTTTTDLRSPRSSKRGRCRALDYSVGRNRLGLLASPKSINPAWMRSVPPAVAGGSERFLDDSLITDPPATAGGTDFIQV